GRRRQLLPQQAQPQAAGRFPADRGRQLAGPQEQGAADPVPGGVLMIGVLRCGERRSWRRVAALVVLALLPAVAGAAEVGMRVLDALRDRPRVRVIVALREPTAPATDLTLRNAEVNAVQGNVLEGLSGDDFTLTHRWQSINAFAGDVTPRGLRALLADP